MKVVIIDNFDSFVYNLYHYIHQLTDDVVVYRVDAVPWDELQACDAIVLSPGPGLPSDLPILKKIVQEFYSTKKILGVCLGHQAIAEAFGAKLKNLNQVLHGLSLPTLPLQTKEGLFSGLPINFSCARYHSWVVDADSLPQELKVTAVDDSGEIMALRHQKFDVHGVQFHPESIMTEFGMEIIENWFKNSTYEG